MDAETKKAIIKYVQERDPDHDIVELRPTADLSGGKISFSSTMIQHREETVLKGEKYAEAYLAVKLVRELNYPLDKFELQKEYPAGHPKTDRPRIDIIVNQFDDGNLLRTFFFIETKDPEKSEAEREDAIQHQLYTLADHERVNDLRYLVYYSVEFDGTQLVDKVDIIDFEQFKHFESWNEAGRPTLDLIPKEYGLARKSLYVNKDPKDLSLGEKALNKTAGPEKFSAIRKDLHNVLWAGGGMFYNDIFSNLVKIFLAKIYDEETTREGEAYKFQIDILGDKPEPPSSVCERVNKLFQDAQKHYLGYSDAQVRKFKGIDTEKISENKIAYVVERLQALSLIENENKANTDVLGNFFEGIVEQGFKQSRGQFFTHTNIVHFLIYALDIPNVSLDLINGLETPAKPRLPFICDPACGSGTFLIESMKLITNAVQASPHLRRSVRNRQFLESMFPPSKLNRWADTYLHGIEINPDLALATKVNMVLHGDGSINIFAQDGLASFQVYVCPDKVSALLNSQTIPSYSYEFEVNEQFDFIISNPPFSIKPEEETKKSYKRRFMFGGDARSENLFLERWYQLLKEGGRLGVVLPESVFDTPAAKKTRLFLYRYFRIDAIVALPYLAFKPYTSTKTCLLIATKKTKEEVREYERHWKKAQGVVRKALRRISSFLNASTPEHQEKALERIRKDGKAERELIAQLVGATSSTPERIAEALNKIDQDDWVTPDKTQLIFSRLARQLDYQIFLAETEEVGYKRRKQGSDLTRPNDLFDTDGNGTIMLDLENPKKVLEKILSRKVRSPKLFGFFSNFSNIGNQVFLRCDPKYRWFWDHMKGKVIPDSKYSYAPLSRFLALARKVIVKKGKLSQERKIIELEDVESGTGHIINVRLVDEVGSDKVEFGDSDIVFSKLEPYLCKAIINDPSQKYIGSTEWVPLIVNGDVAVKEYMWALLISPIGRSVFRLLQSGKRHARINVIDFMDILAPDIPKSEQVKAVRAMGPEWKCIQDIRKELIRSQRAIDRELANSLRGGATTT